MNFKHIYIKQAIYGASWCRRDLRSLALIQGPAAFRFSAMESSDFFLVDTQAKRARAKSQSFNFKCNMSDLSMLALGGA